MMGPPLRLALWALLLAAVPAGACMTSSSHLALIHAALPSPLPEGVIVAEVEIETGGTPVHMAADGPLYSAGLRARVRRMVQGDYAGTTLILRPRYQTSCDSPFDNGTTGYVLGLPRGYEEGVLILDPVTVSRGDGFRLPDGVRPGDPRP